MTFAELGLNPDILKAVEETGYTIPTPIQAQAIPHVLAGRDILGIAQTGTGKTASFTLPMIHLLAQGRPKARMPRSLILEPTRELAAQVAENFEKYGKYHKLSMALLIGGVSFEDQNRKLDRGVDVLICTPGRLLDHVERGRLMLTGVQVLVVDEADRMLDMGFIPDVEKICRMVAGSRQTLFFSATMPPEIQTLVDTFLRDPVRLEIARQATTAETVSQYLVAVGGNDKREALRRLIREEQIKNAMIFCNTKRMVGVLAHSLERHGFSVAALHGDLDQHVRTNVLEAFRAGKIQLLVASDVAARGLDIPDVSHVFNFDVPTHSEDYVHRIGRTGRAGRDGMAITLATPDDVRLVAGIEKLIAKPIPRRVIEDLAVDLDAVSADAPPARGRGRGRNDRGRPSDKRAAAPSVDKDAAIENAAPKPARPKKPAPVQAAAAEEPRPFRERERDRERGPRREGRFDRPRYDDSRNDGPSPLGFGDQMPAFMRIEVRLPPEKVTRPKKSARIADVDDATDDAANDLAQSVIEEQVAI
jgi:superfamily II DNA/RNA helicase